MTNFEGIFCVTTALSVHIDKKLRHAIINAYAMPVYLSPLHWLVKRSLIFHHFVIQVNRIFLYPRSRSLTQWFNSILCYIQLLFPNMHICERFHENILTQLLKPHRKKMWNIIMLANINNNTNCDCSQFNPSNNLYFHHHMNPLLNFLDCFPGLIMDIFIHMLQFNVTSVVCGITVVATWATKDSAWVAATSPHLWDNGQQGSFNHAVTRTVLGQLWAFPLTKFTYL